VPLGGAYLELVAVVDEDEAAHSDFGRWVGDAQPGPIGWAARTTDIEADAARLGVEVVAGSRERADGTLLTWKLAGVERAAAEPSLPFLIEWGPDTPLPGMAPADHRGGPVRLREVKVSGRAVVAVELERASGERFLVPEH
jgi:hypothetical protein